MALTITTLNNGAGVAKTFANIGRDRSSSEWLNTSDTALDSRLIIKSSTLRLKGSNTPYRRVLVQAHLDIPVLDGDGLPAGSRQIIANLTLTCPSNTADSYSPLTYKQDAVAYVRNLVTNAVVEQLARGEV